MRCRALNASADDASPPKLCMGGAGASPYTPGIMIMPAARTETIRFCKDFWIFIMLILPLLRCYAIRLS